MAVRMKYGNLSYVQQPDARGLDLTSFRETGNAIVATATNLQERAIRNENAYNEMAIKMSEYNAIEGEDETALATKIDDTQKAIKEKVDEDGGWFFADTAVTEGARKFLTDRGVKTILNNKAGFDQMMQLNETSDASAEYKAMNRAMILEKFNAAGGSLGLDGESENSIFSFGTALGKGHDRSVMEKELLEIGKAFKADKNYIYKPQVIGDITELMKLPGTPEEVKDACAKIIANRGGALPGYIGQDLNVEVVSEDEVRAVFTSILMNKPEFRQALMKEAELDLWMANKQGIKASDLIRDGLIAEANSNDKIKKQLLTTAGFNNLSKAEQDAILNDDLKLATFLDKGINATYSVLAPQQGETEEAYEARMGAIYSNNYFTNNVNRMLNMSGIFAYQQVTGSSKAQFFDSILSESIRYNHKKMEELKGKQSEKIGYTRGTLPANAMMASIDEDLKNANDILQSAKATIARIGEPTDDASKTLKAIAEVQYADAKNVIDNYNRKINSMFTQLNDGDSSNIDIIRNTALDILNHELIAKSGVLTEDIDHYNKSVDKLNKALSNANNVQDVIDIMNVITNGDVVSGKNSWDLKYPANEYTDSFDFTLNPNLMNELSMASDLDDAKDIVLNNIHKPKEYIRRQLANANTVDDAINILMDNSDTFGFSKMTGTLIKNLKAEDMTYNKLLTKFATVAERYGVTPNSIDYTQFTSIDPNGGAYTEATTGLGMLLDNNPSVWMIDNASFNGKFMEDLIGMPFAYIKENIPGFSAKRSGNDDSAIYQSPDRKIDIIVGSDGVKRLKITLPPQGDSKLPKELILSTKDTGAMEQMTKALYTGVQCCYNHAQTNPYDQTVKRVANEMTALAGLTEPLTANLEYVKDPVERSMQPFNYFNEEARVTNVQDYLNRIISDNNIPDLGKSYDLTTGDYKFKISKTQSGSYGVKVYMFDGTKYKMLKYNAPLNNYAMFDETIKNEDGSYKELKGNETSMEFSIQDNRALLNELPALIYKLNNLEPLIQGFVPTQVTTPQQAAFYQASMRNNPILL